MTLGNIQVAFDQPMQLGECPLWHPAEGAVYWIDIPGQAVHRLHEASKQHASWDLPGEPGCIAIHESGGLLVAVRQGLMHLDTNTGALSLIAPAPYDTSKLRFNDGRCDAAGRLWTGTIYEPRDREAASLYCLEHGVLRDVEHPVTTSNGVAFNREQTRLYHANTPAHRIDVYDYDLNTGTTRNKRLFHAFDSDKSSIDYGGRPDGAAVDSEDAYWSAMFEGSRIVRLSPRGEILQTISLPVRCPTMIAFGGEDLRTLYITTGRKGRNESELAQHPLSGYLLSVRVEVPGVIEYSYKA